MKMNEYKVKISKPLIPQAVKAFREVQAALQEPDSKAKKKILWVAGIFVLFFCLYCMLIPKNHPVERRSKADTAQKENADYEMENRQVFTGEMIRSISKPLFKSPQKFRSDPEVNRQKEVSTPVQGGNMAVPAQGRMSDCRQSTRLNVPPASLLEGHLDGTVVASSIQIPVVAIIDEDFEYQGRVIVPRGSKILGHNAGIQGGNRLLVQFYCLVEPDGATMFSLNGVALDGDKAMGIKGEASRGAVYNLGTSLASTMLGMGMGSAIGGDNSLFGEVANRTIQSATQDLSSTLSHTGESSITVTLDPNVSVKVLVNGY